METIFSKLFVELRKEAGFPTAYRFYHDSGGKDVLKISYRKYLLIEQGKILPVMSRLGTFIWALHMTHKTPKANSFVSAWLKTMAGEENFRELIEPLIAADPGAAKLSYMQKALDKSMNAKKYCITMDQVKVIFANPDNHLCYIAITEDKDAWTIKEFADRLKLTGPAAGKALKELSKVKLVKEIKKGVYKCPIAGMLKDFPHQNTMPAGLRKKIEDYKTGLSLKGKRIYRGRITFRADERELSGFIPVMDVNLTTASTYAIHEKTPNSALFVVEGSVIKLRDF